MKPFIMSLLFSFILTFPSYSQTMLNIAVLELEGTNISENQLVILTNRLRTELIKTGNYNVYERSKVNEILYEQGFQQNVCTNTDCAVEIGKLVGVEKIILGNIDKLNTIYSLDVRMVDVASAKIEKIATAYCERCGINTVFKQLINDVVSSLTESKESDRSVQNKPVPGIFPLSDELNINVGLILGYMNPNRNADKFNLGIALYRNFRFYDYFNIRLQTEYSEWKYSHRKIHNINYSISLLVPAQYCTFSLGITPSHIFDHSHPEFWFGYSIGSTFQLTDKNQLIVEIRKIARKVNRDDFDWEFRKIHKSMVFLNFIFAHHLF